MKKIIVILLMILSNFVYANSEREKHIDYMMGVNRNLSQKDAEKLYNLFEKYSKEHKVNLKLIIAVASVESGFRETATSKAGAYGIMQIMPITAEHYNVDRKNLEENIEAGVKHLRDSVETFGGTDLAIASYNAGIGRIKSTDYRDIPETRYYVGKVTKELKMLGVKLKVNTARKLSVISDLVVKKIKPKKPKVAIAFDLNKDDEIVVTEQETNNNKNETENTEETTEENIEVENQEVDEENSNKIGNKIGFKLGGLNMLKEED